MNNKNENKESDWSEHGQANVHVFEWIGAILIYLFKLGIVDSNEVASQKNSKRNIIVGNIFFGILFIIVILLLTQLS